MKTILCVLACLFSFFSLQGAETIEGYWKSIDEKTDKPQCLVLIYPYEGKYYGRMVGTFGDNGIIDDTIYAPKDRAPGVVGNPFYSGLDFIVNLQCKGSRYKGRILDPQKGKWYRAELWVKTNGNLNVRGELMFFGRNQEWLPAENSDFPKGFKKPDVKTMIPVIPEVD